ncbi:uncharacterized protein [Oscarella lobularis]|uniref:uncharacterized protein n=1 Tax=Oscarella lobularis TaxID=121494 RepID=UPI003313158C
MKTSTKSHVLISEGTTRDSLRDLFALPNNHVNFLSYNTRCAIIMCLEKDDAGRETLKEHLQGLSQADKVKCHTATMLLSTWTDNLCATAESLADAARQSSLSYLLALLDEDGAIELSDETKVKAEKDLNLIRTSSPSLLKRRFVGTAASLSREEDVAFVFDNEFLDTPMTSQERLRAALRIQPNWSIIGRILGPKPFEHFEMHAFEEKRNNRDRALDMLDAWANKFGARATRRHFINAVKDPDVGYSDEVANIFSGPH